MENIKTGIHGGMDSTKVSTNTMVQKPCIPSIGGVAHDVQQFEVNVFGAVAMIKAVLPSMRGRISIPSSNGSVADLPLKSQCVDSGIELHRWSGR
jgi:NAD(P)-dependent dehydrogenase (short-subunit alcohol dehydrogenase family)